MEQAQNREAILKTLLEKFVTAREYRDEKQAEYEAAEKEYRDIEATLWDMLESLNLKSIKYEGYGSIQRAERMFAKIVDDEAAREHFKTQGMLNEVTVVQWKKARVNEYVQWCLENGEILPECLEYTSTKYLTVRR